MVRSVVGIIPYFGPLPTYFGLWLATAGRNSTVDWVLLTDQAVPAPPKNVRVERTTLAGLRRRFAEALDCPIALDAPYKLCDFKPAYGFLFPDLVDGYDFWAHADLDVIWGGLRTFLTEEILDRSDKVFAGGHLSLFRNRPEVNEAFRGVTTDRPLDYRTVFGNPQAFAFDEWGPNWNGMNAIVADNGLRLYVDEMPYADIKVSGRALRTVREDFGEPSQRQAERRKHHILYRYQSGHLYQHAIDREVGLVCREEAYLHLQKRPMRVGIRDVNAGSFLVVPPNRFIEDPGGRIDASFLRRVCRERGPYWHYESARLHKAVTRGVAALGTRAGIKRTPRRDDR